MRVTDNNVFFWGGYFSQWNSSFSKGKDYQFIDENNIKFTSCEQYMMYGKAMLFNDEITANKILNIKNVKEIKQLGREVKNFENELWDQNKLNIVIKGNFFKFSQNDFLKKELLKYSTKEFVEASPVDKIWGIGLHYENDDVLDKNKWNGQNLLGKAIIEAMSMIKNDIKDLDEYLNMYKSIDFNEH